MKLTDKRQSWNRYGDRELDRQRAHIIQSEILLKLIRLECMNASLIYSPLPHWKKPKSSFSWSMDDVHPPWMQMIANTPKGIHLRNVIPLDKDSKTKQVNTRRN